MKSNIRIAFEKCQNEKRPALLTYTVAGDNTKKKSLEILFNIALEVIIGNCSSSNHKLFSNDWCISFSVVLLLEINRSKKSKKVLLFFVCPPIKDDSTVPNCERAIAKSLVFFVEEDFIFDKTSWYSSFSIVSRTTEIIVFIFFF